MQVGNRLAVRDERPEVRNFRISETRLSPQQQVQCLSADLEFLFEQLSAILRRFPPVEIRLSGHVLLGEFLEGVANFVSDFQLLSRQHVAGFREAQFNVLDLSLRRSQAQRHFQNETS